MALEPSSPPAAAVAALHRALGARAAQATFSSSNLARALPHNLSISMPHRLAYLPLQTIKPEMELRKLVEYRSWRFFVHEKRDNAGAVEQHVPIAAATAAGDEAYELGEVNEGPFVAGTVKAISVAEELEEVSKGRFEPVFLIVPAVYVAALWLQNLEGGSDIILTIPPSNPALLAYQPMSPVEFIKVVHQLAWIACSPYRNRC
jgi:hypothetical protein